MSESIEATAIVLRRFDTVLPSTFIPLLPLHDVVFDQGEGLPFSDSSPSTAAVKFTSKFKWRLTLPALNLFPFQTSTLKIYSVGDKQDAAAFGPWRSWKLMSVFTDVLWDWAKSLVLTFSQQLPLKTQTKLWQTAAIHTKNTKTHQENYRTPWTKQNINVLYMPTQDLYPLNNTFSSPISWLKGTVLLPLHPRTSTSLSVWVLASSPDAGELFLHHSCSREAANNHKECVIMILILKQYVAIFKKGTFTEVQTFFTLTHDGHFELCWHILLSLNPGVTEPFTKAHRASEEMLYMNQNQSRNKQRSDRGNCCAALSPVSQSNGWNRQCWSSSSENKQALLIGIANREEGRETMTSPLC